MFESRKNFYSSKQSYKKPTSYYGKHSGSKYKTKKHKGTLIELDDNFTYQSTEQTTISQASNVIASKECQHEDNIACKEIAEFTLNETSYHENIIDNKENISSLSNIQENNSILNSLNNNNIRLQKNVSSSSINSSEISFDTIHNNNSSTQINVSNETMKEAFFFPKKLTNIYNYIYNQFQYQLYTNVNNNNNQVYQGNTISQVRTTSNTNITSSYSKVLNVNNTPQHNSYLRNNSSSTLLVRSNSSITSSSNSSCSIAPFSCYDTTPPFSNNQKVSNNSFGLNKMNLSHVNNANELTDKEKENTDVLSINLKISDKDILVFKIRRYDDMFQTVKIFCEINHLDQKFIRPLILNVIKAMNVIYGFVNMTLNEDEIKELKRIKNEVI